MEIAEADRDKNFVIIRLQGAIYVGQGGYNFAVTKEKVPHGFGYLRLDDGSQHQGFFCKGRAAGKGILLTPAGLQIEGEWKDNVRVGRFRVLDSTGKQWVEVYAEDGKRLSRKRLKVEGAPASEEPTEAESEAPRLEPASRCWNCSGLYHREYNNPYACRRHRGRWEIDRSYRGDKAPPPGVYTCCALKSEDAPGCAFLPHALDHGEGS